MEKKSETIKAFEEHMGGSSFFTPDLRKLYKEDQKDKKIILKIDKFNRVKYFKFCMVKISKQSQKTDDKWENICSTYGEKTNFSVLKLY